MHAGILLQDVSTEHFCIPAWRLRVSTPHNVVISVSVYSRVALWNGLLRSCNQACKMFANGYSADGDAKEPILDFFGVSVKAEDVPQQVERMYLLKKRV